jgi:hypothetical protein
MVGIPVIKDLDTMNFTIKDGWNMLEPLKNCLFFSAPSKIIHCQKSSDRLRVFLDPDFGFHQLLKEVMKLLTGEFTAGSVPAPGIFGCLGKLCPRASAFADDVCNSTWP